MPDRLIFLSSLAESSQACTLYNSLLHMHASIILIREDINILLSVKTCLISFNFWYADQIRKLRKLSAMDHHCYL